MQQTAVHEQIGSLVSSYEPKDFRYASPNSLYEQIALIAKQVGVCIRQYTGTKISFDNGFFGRRISGIESIVQTEFMPAETKLNNRNKN